jgi:hypothetical protein
MGDLTQSQKAILIAREQEQSPKMDVREAARAAGVDLAYVALAELALKYVPELLESVESGQCSLVDMYELASERKKRSEARKPVKPNLTNLRPGQILSYPTGDLRTAEARHTR